MPISRLVAADSDNLSDTDEGFENTLRPQGFSEVIGREREKETLKMMIKAAKARGEAIDHVLLHGPPGLGKTSLAHVIANEMNATIHVTSGPAIEKQGDLAAILTAMQKNSILFIDEIHRLHRSIEEILYPAMEDRALDIVVGKGAGAKTVRVDLEAFTIIAATTRMGLLSKPLLDRFGVDFRLDFYNKDEMRKLIQQKSVVLGIDVLPDAAQMIADRARRTPRVGVKILKRVHDNAVASEVDRIDTDLVEKTLKLLEIDSMGLDYLDRKILEAIISRFRGGPVGLQALAAAISEEVSTISDVYEPFLLQEGLIERTARGRVATSKAFSHLGVSME